MAGAAVLCTRAVLRGGAGLVRAAIPESIQSVVALGEPCAMTAGLDEDLPGRIHCLARKPLLDLAREADAIAVGPGLGRSAGVTVVVRALLAETPVPLVLDADALNALGQDTAILKQRTAPLVLTPHPGEFARLTGNDTAAVQADRQGRAVAFAAAHGVVLVLKGEGTLVTDGARLFVNATGNPGMATGGSGDVLTGLIAALLGQKLPAFEAAQLGVHLHGLAGDLAARAKGEVSLTASDVVDYLGHAFQAHSG
jgi:NAD(P)H-hydrate epimerase